MPWQEMAPMDLRSQFVAEFGTGWFTMTELADTYRISRKTAYKWVRRHAQDGATGLADRSRRPRRCPHAPSAAVIKALLDARRRHPTWGAPKLIAWLQRQDPSMVWARELHRVRAAARRRARCGAVVRVVPLPPGNPRLSTPIAPNDLWTVDYKRGIPHGRRALVLPVDAARRREPLCLADRRVGRPDVCDHAPAVCPRVRRVWPSAGAPERQRDPLRQYRLGRIVPTRGVVVATRYSARAHSPGASRTERRP